MEGSVGGGSPEFEFIEDRDFDIVPGSGAVGGAVVEDDFAEAVVGFGKGDARAPDDFAGDGG